MANDKGKGRTYVVGSDDIGVVIADELELHAEPPEEVPLLRLEPDACDLKHGGGGARKEGELLLETWDWHSDATSLPRTSPPCSPPPDGRAPLDALLLRDAFQRSKMGGLGGRRAHCERYAPPCGALRLDEFPSAWVPRGFRSWEGAACSSARRFLLVGFYIESRQFLRCLRILGAVHRSRSDGLKIGGTCYKDRN
jgi:hypothetical protein